MAPISLAQSAWSLLVLGDGSPTNRLANAFSRLLEVSVDDLSTAQNDLLERLPLNHVRTFGPQQMTHYTESLADDSFQEYASIIARLHLLALDC